MTQTARTKGPWEMVKGDRQIIITGDDKSYDIAIVRCVSEKFDNEANARLIAAAPELYEQLKDVLRSCRKDFGPGENAQAAFEIAYAEPLAAIAKARVQA